MQPGEGILDQVAAVDYDERRIYPCNARVFTKGLTLAIWSSLCGAYRGDATVLEVTHLPHDPDYLSVDNVPVGTIEGDFILLKVLSEDNRGIQTPEKTGNVSD